MARITLTGIPVSPGIAIGPILLLANDSLYERRHIEPAEIPAETEAIIQASSRLCARLENIRINMPFGVAEEIITAQMEIARDAKIIDNAIARVKHRKICAVWALSETIDELGALFENMDDPYLSERSRDIETIGKYLLEEANGLGKCAQKKMRGILAAIDPSAADILAINPENLMALVAQEGGSTSHAAILARGMKIPAIIGVSDLFQSLTQDETAIVDGLKGHILLGPDKADIDHYKLLKAGYEDFEKDAVQSAILPAITTDKKTLTVLANLENPSQAPAIKESGAEGVGLYRTEFSFMSGDLPDEDELTREYETIIFGACPQKVVFRTLDVGADKLIKSPQALHEPNPALGMRGIRLCLREKDLFKRQLRAILRASRLEPASIMLPMVTTMAEVAEVKSILENVSRELKKQSISHAFPLPLGVMIETPAATMIADSLAAQCDFLSIGTNDLLHYLMAIDRSNRHVAYLHEPLHPAFMRSLRYIIRSGHKYGKKVSVCGEFATDPFGVALLMGLDIDALSVPPGFVPRIKHLVRKLSLAKCQEMARIALRESDMGVTRSSLRSILETSIGAELAFHSSLMAD